MAKVKTYLLGVVILSGCLRCQQRVSAFSLYYNCDCDARRPSQGNTPTFCIRFCTTNTRLFGLRRRVIQRFASLKEKRKLELKVEDPNDSPLGNDSKETRAYVPTTLRASSSQLGTFDQACGDEIVLDAHLEAPASATNVGNMDDGFETSLPSYSMGNGAGYPTNFKAQEADARVVYTALLTERYHPKTPPRHNHLAPYPIGEPPDNDCYHQFLKQMPSDSVSFLRIPSMNGTTQSEFHNKIAHFLPYTPRDIALVNSVRLRIVLQGMAASPLEPAVYRAFEILYQDLLPLRLAGRLIFRRLSYVMNMVVTERRQQLDVLLNTTSLPIDVLGASQYAFLLFIQDTASKTAWDDSGINTDREHDVMLPLAQLKRSGLMSVIGERMEMEEDEIWKHMQTGLPRKDHMSLTFTQFVWGLQQCIQASPLSSLPSQNHSSQLQVLLGDFIVYVARRTNMVGDHVLTRRALDERRQQYSDRFECMLDAFSGWQPLEPPPEHQGRMVDVVRGCFVGAKNEAIREALRVAYVDHPAMRVAGNTIFSLVSAMIPSPSQQKH
jgi:hypothetical protein